jgi:hypothetical protein
LLLATDAVANLVIAHIAGEPADGARSGAELGDP